MEKTSFQYCRISDPKTDPFVFQDGRSADPLTIAYETYGMLDEDKSNAILVIHALSGSAHAAGHNPDGPNGPERQYWTDECHTGWWTEFIGPGKALDTDKFFVICANYPGSCYGSSGPASINPETEEPYGAAFPNLTMTDIVEANARLLDRLGIASIFAVVGGSLGACMALEYAIRYPMKVKCVIPIAGGVRTSALSKAHNFEQIYAIEEDADFRGGNYYDGVPPKSGLTLARIISHKTFVSLAEMESRAARTIIQPDDYLSGYNLQHQIESYILHQGRKFARRFDANAYLRIINAWQSFDILKRYGAGKTLSEILSRCHAQSWLIFSISSDVCFYPEEQAEIAYALKQNQIDCQYLTVHSDKGHDSFLLEPELFAPYIHYKLDTVFAETRAGKKRAGKAENFVI